MYRSIVRESVPFPWKVDGVKAFLSAAVDFCNRFLDAVMPAECVVCRRPLVDGEKYLCLHCDCDMPLLNITSPVDNVIHETLASTRPVDRAAALFFYHRGSPFTRLIRRAKYNDLPQLARLLGERLGQAYLDSGFFEGIDALVPVPVNRWKEMRRGYNQSVMIARGLRNVTSVPVLDCLKARRHSTQTRKNAGKRFQNTRGIYSVRKACVKTLLDSSSGRPLHLLLVDDVITTGSTVLQCAEALRNVNPSVNISVIAPAFTEIS